MKFPLSKLFVVVAVASIVALAIGKHVNSPERKIRLAGVNYEPNRKGGKFLTLPDNAEWNDEKLAQIVEIAAEFDQPHAIGIIGGSVTDDGFKVFANATNISSIVVIDSNVSEAIFDSIVGLPDLKYLTITNCPNIDQSEIHEFRLANPKIDVQPF
jgi:4-hydroxy-3-methylbut-2-en-1-yl diphosphate synthase IspG/GcpE